MKLHELPLPYRLILIAFAFLAKDSEAYTFRVLVAFTEQAEAYNFSPFRAASAINGITREVYENSSPTYSSYQMPKVELAGTVKVAYTGSNTNQAKIALRGTTDGEMDEIHALRDKYRADIVILVHPFTNSGGEAYAVEIDNENKAFAVVSAPHFATTLPAHEIGHLVGCIHDFEDPVLVHSSIKYAYGYVDPSNAWGTAMTYHNNRQRWFSNPYETYNGDPRGIADSADCTRKHHERKSTLSAYRTTPNAVTTGGVHLGENESFFWDLTGDMYFLAPSSLDKGLVSLKSAQNVHFLSFPHVQIVSQQGWVFLKSAKTVGLSGVHVNGTQAFVVADSLHFPNLTETVFRNAVVNLNANVIYHKDGASVSIEPDSTGSTLGSYVWMYARKQIRLTDGFKIRSKDVSMRISDSYDPFDSINVWENILEKPAVSQEYASSSLPASFQSRVVQERGALSLEYSLPERGPVSIRVFDLKGRLAGSADIRHPRPGLHTVAIPGSFKNGTVYFLRVTANGKVHTHRFVMGF